MKILIVDDEMPARERLERMIDEAEIGEVVGEAADGASALEMAQNLRPDVVLLDIRMPGMDGIEVARHLSILDAPPAVIFATAFDQYAIDAFEAHAMGYLLKPVRKDKLVAALQSASRVTRPQIDAVGQRSPLGARRMQISVRVRDRLKLIPVADVRCFLADQKYVTVKHAGGEDLIEDSLKTLEEEFAPDFVRVHRNALVCIRHIDSVARDTEGQLEVVMKHGGDRLPVSRRLGGELLKLLRG